MITAPPGNGEAFRSACPLTLTGGFDAVSVYRLTLSRFAARLRHRLLVLIRALLISLIECAKNTLKPERCQVLFWGILCQCLTLAAPRLRQRQRKPERRANAFLTFDPHLSSMLLDDGPANMQSQPQSHP